MAKRTCSIDGCERAHSTRGWCYMHYRRALRAGEFVPNHPKGLEERFWDKVEKTDTCWNWTGSITNQGYGSFGGPNGTIKPHRYTYETRVGPIPAGMQIDHMCHNRACVNPEHLRVVTHKQNQENHRGASSNSKSGVRGVYRARRKWRANVTHEGRHYNVGRFDTLEQAEAAVIAKRNELYTHNDLDRGEAAA